MNPNWRGLAGDNISRSALRKRKDLLEKLMRQADPNFKATTQEDLRTYSSDEENNRIRIAERRAEVEAARAEKDAESEEQRRAIEEQAKKTAQENEIRKYKQAKIKEIQDKFVTGKITNEGRIAAITAITQAGEQVPDSRDVLNPSQDPDKARSSVSQVGQAFGGAIVNTATKAVAGAASLTGGILEKTTNLDYAAKDLQEFGKKGGEASDLLGANTMANRPGENKFVTNLSSGAGSLVASLALAYMGAPAVAVGAAGLGAGGDQYRGAKEAGKSTTDALTTGLAAGTAEAALEKIGLDKFLGAKGSVVKKTLTRSLVEGTQEAAQSLSQSAISASYQDVDVSEAIGQALIEGGYGALVGGGAGFTTALAENLTARGVDPEDANITAEAVAAKITPIVEKEIGLPPEPPTETPVAPPVETPTTPEVVPEAPPVAQPEPFDTKTEIEQINRILENKDTVAGGEKIADYYRRAKGEDWQVVEMTPDEYLQRAKKALGDDYGENTIEQVKSGDPKKYAEDMRKGDKFPMPWINEVAGTQEGRTRALAAKELGMEKIKVAVATKSTPEKPVTGLPGVTDEKLTLYRGSNETNTKQASPDRPVYYADTKEYAETYGEVSSKNVEGRVLTIDSSNSYDRINKDLRKAIAKYVPSEKWKKLTGYEQTEIESWVNHTLEGERLSKQFNKPMPEVVKKAFADMGIDYIRIPGDQFKGTTGKVGHQTEIIEIPKPKPQPTPTKPKGSLKPIKKAKTAPKQTGYSIEYPESKDLPKEIQDQLPSKIVYEPMETTGGNTITLTADQVANSKAPKIFVDQAMREAKKRKDTEAVGKLITLKTKLQNSEKWDEGEGLWLNKYLFNVEGKLKMNPPQTVPKQSSELTSAEINQAELGGSWDRPKLKELFTTINKQNKNPQMTVRIKGNTVHLEYKDGTYDLSIPGETLGISGTRFAQSGIKDGDKVNMGSVLNAKGKVATVRNPSGQNFSKAEVRKDKDKTSQDTPMRHRTTRTPEQLVKLANDLNKVGQTNAIKRRGQLKSKDAAGLYQHPRKNGKGTDPRGVVKLKDNVIEDPQMYTTILAHELSHAIESQVMGNTRSTFEMLDVSKSEKKTVEAEFQAIVDNIEGAEVAQSDPSYYYKRTEMLARFVETLVLEPATARKLAPTVSDKFEALMAREPAVRDLFMAIEDKWDVKYANFTPDWLKDMRQMFQKELGKRAGLAAYQATVARRAELQRGIQGVEKLLKSKFKGVKDDSQLLFRAAESIKVTEGGNPTFGTNDYQSNVREDNLKEFTDNGWKVISENMVKIKENGDAVYEYDLMKPRYTPEQGKEIFAQLSPEGQKLIKEFTAAKEEAIDAFNREMMKEVYKIESNLEGWVHRGIQKEEKKKLNLGMSIKGSLRKQQAGMKKKRGTGENYVEDFRKQIEKAMIDGEVSVITNEFIDRQLARISKPLAKNQKPDKGWTKIIADEKGGLRLPGEGTKIMIMQEDGTSMMVPNQEYQAPKQLVKYYREIRDVYTEASRTAKVLNQIGKYWGINVLIHQGSTATNAISGGIQLSIKYIDNLYADVLDSFTGDVDFDRTKRNLTAPIMALTPNGFTKAPSWAFGGYRATLAGQFATGDITSDEKIDKGIDEYGNKMLKLFGAVDIYFKRLIFLAEGGDISDAAKRKYTERLNKEEQLIIGQVNEIVDLYGLDYDNTPLWLQRWDRSGAKLVKPFMKYPFKYSKLVMRYATASVDSSLPPKERISKTLTLMTVVGLIAAAYDRQEEESETPKGTEDVPYQLKPGGRVYVGKDDQGREIFVRVAKYPFFNLTSYGKALWNRNFDEALDITREQFGTVGVGAEVAMLFTGKKDEFDQYKSTEAIVGEITSSFIPAFRTIKDIGDWIDPVSRKPDTFMQSVGQTIPIWGDEETRRKMRGNKRTVEIPITDTEASRTVNSPSKVYYERDVQKFRSDILLSSLTGIYLSRIDPKEAKAYEIYGERKAAETEVVENLRKGDEAKAKAIAKEHGLIIKPGTFDYYRRNR